MSVIKYYIRKIPCISELLRFIYRTIRNVFLHIKSIPTSLVLYNEISIISKNSKKIWYLCSPVHKNMGDQAQAYCIRVFLKNNFKEYSVVEISTRKFLALKRIWIKLIHKKLFEDDIFIFQSGYCMTDEHPDERVHIAICNVFFNNKILFMPQTLLYKKQKQIIKKSQIYNKNHNIIMMLRDKESFKKSIEYFPQVQKYLFPDIVTSLINLYNFDSVRDGVLFCMRSDGEQYYSKKEISVLIEEISKCTNVELTDTSFKTKFQTNNSFIEKELCDLFNSYSKYRAIITDRFHGTIFSVISNTPVIVLTTSDHKVATGVSWFFEAGYKNIFFARDVSEAGKYIMDILKDNNCVLKTDNYFREKYWDELVNIIGRV